jgi:regulatory protein
MSSSDEHLATVSYLPGVRPPHTEEARPDREDDGWHVEGAEQYRDEEGSSVLPGRDDAGDPHSAADRAADDSESLQDGAAADEIERLSPRHPAGKGRARGPALRSVGSVSDAPGGADESSGDVASADAPRDADPRLSSALERMSKLVAAVEQAREEPESEPEPDEEELAARAERISMHALTRRGVSTTELRRTLVSRDLPEHVVEAEIERLVRVGLLDDAALASTLVRTLTERKGLGRQALSSELRRRGLDSHVVVAALDELDGDDEGARADELAQKRVGQLRSLDRATAERRLVAFLQRKGYSGSVAATAARKALGSSSSGVRFE